MLKKSYPAPKLGKLPARRNAIRLKFAKYVDRSTLPKVPAQFGHEGLIGSTQWQMLGNDTLGDCVIAGAFHETMLWNKIAGTNTPVSAAAAVAMYEKIAGYDPKQPKKTDKGTDMEAAARYRRQTGIVDAAGKVHKVAAYLDLKKGDLSEHLLAAYLFGAVGIGIKFPGSAMDQFNAGQPWDVVKGATLDGGHYVPLVACRENLEVVTWGRVQGMTTRFFAKYNDESVAYVSEEFLVGGKSPEGFDIETLKADLAKITG